MTEIRQPSFADIWGDLDEETRGRIFPLLKDDDRRAVLEISKAVFDEAARKEQLETKAVEALFWDDVKVRKQQLQRERSGAASSWDAVDVDGLFDTEQEVPTVGEFLEGDMSNGGALFYPGKVNEIHGPSESGKTMVLLAVAAQEIRAGNHVVMVDFEDGGRSIVNRLRHVFGLDREEIVKQFHYFRPETAFDDDAFEGISKIEGVTFAIIDAVTEGMSLAQLDGRNENEVATWYNSFPKRLARLEWAVCVVDHTSKDNSTHAIGSQHKKSGVDGVSYTAEPISPFVRGGRGKLRLKIAKDKPGGIRPMALPQGEGKQYWRGDFEIDGRHDAAHPRVALTGVDPAHFSASPNTGPDLSKKDVTPVIPPPGEAVILEILAESAEWMSAQGIMEWHNERLDPKDPKRIKRTLPRKMAVKLIGRGLAERRDSGGSVLYKITPDGLHSANAWSNQAAERLQTELEIEGS